MSNQSQVLVEVTTKSTVTYFSKMPPPVFPIVKLNGKQVPPPQKIPTDYSASGFLALVVDSTRDVTDPASILANLAIPIWPENGTNWWWPTYETTYNVVVNTVLNAGNTENQLLVVASYGLDNNMTPNNDALYLFLSFGAGEQLQIWGKTADSGSQVDNPDSWVGFPANYVLAGFSGTAYGLGAEKHEQASPEIDTSFSATLTNIG